MIALLVRSLETMGPHKVAGNGAVDAAMRLKTVACRVVVLTVVEINLDLKKADSTRGPQGLLTLLYDRLGTQD